MHIVQPVSQLDKDNAQVFGHGYQHLPQVLRLLLPGGQATPPYHLLWDL